MEIKITITPKRVLITLGIMLAFGATCFCAGKFSRFGRISGTSQELVDGIVLERDTANKLLDELGIARPAGQSAVDAGYAVLRGVQELSKSNDTALLCISEIEREVDLTQQNAEIIKQSFDGVSDAIEYGWRISEEQAAAYERIIETLQQFNKDSGKDDEESTAGPRDSQ